MVNAVELVDVTKSFKTQKNREFIAVDSINLTIKTGEFFSLLGPSGCGKTTLLRMIAGFENPTEGTIYLNGEAMGERPPFHRPVNTVFQNYALFPHLSVAQNVAFGLKMDGVSLGEMRSRVGEAITLVKLNGMEQRYPRQLSGGQQQRVALARAIVKKPQVLLFDEPLGALDLKLRKEMQLELKQMQQQLGITFVYVTHDQEEALTMSDRIAVLSEGKSLQIGSPIEIYEKPNCRFVADFIGESNFLVGPVIEKTPTEIVVLIDGELPIIVSYKGELPVGKIVTLVIRPEKITLHPIQSWEEANLVGTITEQIYLGTDTRFVIQLTSCSSIVLRRQNFDRKKINTFSTGDRVAIRIAHNSIQILEEGVLPLEKNPSKTSKSPSVLTS